MLVPCVDVMEELRAVVVVLSVERAEKVRGDDVALAGAEEGDCEEGTGLVRVDAAADATDDAAFEAIDDGALDNAVGAEDGALTGVVGAGMAEMGDKDGMTKVGS
jgi:hypothetical protein